MSHSNHSVQEKTELFFFKSNPLETPPFKASQDLLSLFDLSSLYQSLSAKSASIPTHYDALLPDIPGKVDTRPSHSLLSILHGPPVPTLAPSDMKELTPDLLESAFSLSPEQVTLDPKEFGLDDDDEESTEQITNSEKKSNGKFVIRLDLRAESVLGAGTKKKRKQSDGENTSKKKKKTSTSSN